jgi:mono/diheme cytochrome c family protein
MSIEMRAFWAALFAGCFVVGATFLLGKLEAPSPGASKLPAEAPPALNSEIAEGGKSYQYSCARCHASDGYGNDKQNVPSLVDEDMSDGEMVVEIEYGENRMPSFVNQYDLKQTQ